MENDERSKLQNLIKEKINSEITEPQFYAINGSDIYGYESNRNIIDVMGFHTIEPDEYSYMYPPEQKHQMYLNTQINGERYEIKIQSYELKKFAEIINQSNFSVIELICCSNPIINNIPKEIENMKSYIQENISPNISQTNIGIAKSQYYHSLDPNKKQEYNPTPEKFLQVYRSLLAAKCILDTEEIISDITKLSTHVEMADRYLVENLIQLQHEKRPITEELENRAHNQINLLIENIEIPENKNENNNKKQIDTWMRRIR
jgi:predicted nucleotidyltransferase